MTHDIALSHMIVTLTRDITLLCGTDNVTCHTKNL